MAGLSDVAGRIAKYAVLASRGVHAAEAVLGPGNGAEKQRAAIAYTLVAAHPGETVEKDKLNEIAAAVNLVVALANAFGVFGAVKVERIEVPLTKECGEGKAEGTK